MKYFAFLFFLLIIFSCKSKTKPTEPFFSFSSLIKHQIEDVDTSIYNIRKIVIKDSLHSDTNWLNPKEFKIAAKDFLIFPDLSQKKFSSQYSETKWFDTLLHQATFFYTPIQPQLNDIKRISAIIKLGPNNEYIISSILLDRIFQKKDTSLEQHLFWKIDKSFQITNIIQNTNAKDDIQIIQVNWNKF